MSEPVQELQSVDDDERATRDADPAYLSPDYVGTPPALAAATAAAAPADALGADRPGVRARRDRRARPRPHAQHDGEPLGERIIVSGRVLDSDGRPVRNALIEIWQANAAGRYRHHVDQHPAPLDPNFTGAGRCMTDDDGRYRFVSIKPGAYPWKNHDNAWRPAHIHLSVFGRAFTERLVTQMYFPGDPLFPYDPIFQSVRDPRARERMISAFDLATTAPSGRSRYRFDVVLGGSGGDPAGERVSLPRTPAQTVGPFFDFALCARPASELVASGRAGRDPDRGRRARRRRRARARRHGRDLAGGCRGALRRRRSAGGAAPTDADGRFAFTTVKPGAVREPDGSVQAPHISVLCFARGLLKPVLTRLYFADEAEANAADPVLRAIGDEGERATLLAQRRPARRRYRFDIRLQGDGETVFFTTPASGL